MKTLSNPRDKNELLLRFANVHADSQPRWGAMSAHQMICHLSDSFRGSLGEKYVTPATSLLKRTLLKWVALWVPLRSPHRIKTLPEMDQQKSGTPPSEFASASEAFPDLVSGRELRTLTGHLPYVNWPENLCDLERSPHRWGPIRAAEFGHSKNIPSPLIK